MDTRAAAHGALTVSPANDGARGGAVETFAFGDPEAVLDRRQLLDLFECWHNGRWFEPPIPRDGLARAFRASPHHSSAILLKRNLLVASLEPTPYLSRATFEKIAQDFLIFGDAFVAVRQNRLGDPLRLEHSPAKYTRRGVEAGRFFFAPGNIEEVELPAGRVIQIMQPDINQEIYGVPEYLSALQSALLNEAATLFRRRYYLNGSHAGYILYATGDIDEADTVKLQAAMKASKGPGNFRNMFVHAPNGKDGSLKILPVAEAGAKDEFLGIKNTTRDDVLAAHRVPPQLIGVVPAQGSALGKVSEAVDGFHEMEVQPLQARFLDINEQLGIEAVRFRERITAKAA